ncbi:hypothetical protein GCM10027277_14910 [Pseudoduganella ginsengisoli]|uniref:Uncharacterized protein n=1 Tax=Pseudoduganella ginsengisoli TaxID=1462440 RepID=A0A6L6PW62_9BURK|nr:hypothetical protein [Pseudoduganella ginsengisoli]MTW01248.1 hypothetical protein [Pseudoduganella ginsengisoli]
MTKHGPKSCQRTDQRTEAIVQHAIALMSVAGVQEAARYLRRFNVAPETIKRIVGNGRRRIVPVHAGAR